MLQYQPSSQLHPGHRESAANFKRIQSSLKNSSPPLLPHVQPLLHIVSLTDSVLHFGWRLCAGKAQPVAPQLFPQNSTSVIATPPHQQVAVNRLAGGYVSIATNGSLTVRKHTNHPHFSAVLLGVIWQKLAEVAAGHFALCLTLVPLQGRPVPETPARKHPTEYTPPHQTTHGVVQCLEQTAQQQNSW